MKRCTSERSACSARQTWTSWRAHAPIRASCSHLISISVTYWHSVCSKKPSVIIFRLADERRASVNQRLATVLEERAADLESGTLILIEDARYRVRKLPIG